MQQDYNNTINLPKTEFPMRAGLPKREPGFLENWEKNDLYHELMKKNEGKPLFVLHDGPPYANGNLHMGHALNKILKDFILRSRNMMGYQAPYIPGWDTHGLPIERQAIKAYGMDRSKVSTAEFRSKCEEFAHNHVNTQRTQFKRLGIIGDWDRPYLTLTHDYEAAQIEIFGEMAKKGYIYKGQKPVYWCPHDETALAEAEIEYKDVPCKSIFVKFAVTDDKGVITKLLGTKENVYFVIWTTTTWTIPGNLAISLNPNFEYDFVKVPNGEVYVLAKELVASVMKTAGIDSWEVLATVLGSDLELIKTKHPLFDRDSLVITGDHVTLDAGTGCVHTAPGFGADDFIVCQRYNIPIIVPVDGKGRHTAESGKYEGMFVAKPVIVQLVIGKGIQQAERIIDIGRRPGKMITVIFLLQLLQRFLFAHFLRNGKPFYISCHLFLHFFLSDATNGGIGLQHTDIQDIVQLAEDAELGEFGNAGQEHKAKIRVARLQRAVKIAHHVTENGKIRFLMHHIQQRRVILVNKDYHLSAGLFVGTHDE